MNSIIKKILSYFEQFLSEPIERELQDTVDREDIEDMKEQELFQFFEKICPIVMHSLKDKKLMASMEIYRKGNAAIGIEKSYNRTIQITTLFST